MRKIALAFMTGTLLAGGAATQASARTFIYAVTVTTSFGSTFKDCWTFQKGVVTATDLGKLIYTPAPTDPNFYYSAVTSPAETAALGHSFAFSGYEKGDLNDSVVHAVGADDKRHSYVVRGHSETSCTAPAGGSYEP